MVYTQASDKLSFGLAHHYLSAGLTPVQAFELLKQSGYKIINHGKAYKVHAKYIMKLMYSITDSSNNNRQA